MTDYPHRWRRVARGGYGYVELVPCRILDKGRARWTIAALRADGTEAVRTVKPENVVEPPQESKCDLCSDESNDALHGWGRCQCECHDPPHGYQPMLKGMVEICRRMASSDGASGGGLT